MIQIKEFTLSVFDAFVSLIDACFKLRNQDKQGLISWKFLSHIWTHPSKIYCAYEDGKIVGQYSNIAYEFKRNTQIVPGYMCQDMCVSKEKRGQ